MGAEMTEAGITTIIDNTTYDQHLYDNPGYLDASAFGRALDYVAGDGNNNFIGTNFDDTISGGGGNDSLGGNGGDDVVNGGSGIDTLSGGDGDDVVIGGGGNDFVYGNDGADTLTGDEGDDIITGGLGADLMTGGIGNDTYYADLSDTIIENAGEGTDTVYMNGTYTLSDVLENLVLTGSGNFNGTGNSGNNSITGNSGDNILDGGAGADTMSGGLGADIYIVDNSADIVSEAGYDGKFDEIRASASFTVNNLAVEQLTLTGSGNINGTGNSAANIILGNVGDNHITGLGGADMLTGGGGSDVFVYSNVADSTSAARDTITDFQSGDKIDLSAIDANYNTPANEAFTYVGSAAFSHTAGELRVYTSGTEWIVEADRDGDGAADMTIGGTIDSGYVPTAADFVF
ncbi:MAG: calcium-binding protein [Alphaproteobacteria bacterium]|nr:MAG: calcium-binding protein [Alphaproteobacteria bacterium]